MSTAPLLIQPLADGRWRWFDEPSSHQGSVDELKRAASGRRLLLAVPGESVSLFSARAPTRNRVAWRRALHYALEDRLAEPVDTLHFAVGPTAADGSTPVAVLRAESLAAWLDTLRGTGLDVVSAIPDMLLLPRQTDHWSLLVDSGRVLVRQGDYSGFVCDEGTLSLLLDRALAESDPPPTGLMLQGTLPGPDTLNIPLDRQAGPVDPLLVLRSVHAPQLDLLQGRFQRSAQLRRWVRPWRLAATLAGLLLITRLAELGLENAQLIREQERLRESTEQLYRQAVPDAQRVINPRAQLAGHLQSLGDGGNGSGFLDLLASSGEILHQFPELRLQAMRYRDGRLELDLEGGQMETLERLQERLRRDTTLQIEVRASMREDQVISRLSVTPS